MSELIYDPETGDYLDSDDIAAELAALRAEAAATAPVSVQSGKPVTNAAGADDDEGIEHWTPGTTYAPDSIGALKPDFQATSDDPMELPESKWARFWSASAEAQS